MTKTRFLLAAAWALATGSALAQAAPSNPSVQGPVTPTAAAAGTIKIGLIGPLTGPSSDFGLPMLNGVKLAIDEINSFGGYLGRPLELVIKDDQANPELGLKLSLELVKEKVIATIGFCNTGVAMKSIEVFQANQLPLLVPCTTGTPVTTKFAPADSFIFRNAPADAIQAPFMVDEIVARKLTKVAVFADNTGYGEAGLKDVQKALERRNLKPVYVGRFDLGVKDVTEQLKEARNAGADVLFIYTIAPQNAVVAKGRHALGWKVPQVGAWALSFPLFIDGAKEAAEGSLMALSFVAEPTNERRATFLASYARKFNAARIPVPMAAAQAYDATYLLAHAVLSLPSDKLSGPHIKQALEQPKRAYYGVVTTYEKPFRNDREALSQNMLVVGTVKNGLVTFAHPEDAMRNHVVQRKRIADADRSARGNGS
ncbi:ABC transporter substrate-binding protein [Variovorax sp. J22R115]|uniref:ABC transporter substrate-binding protein n=1 Tax=Variovorax sp. J22R115 TaxID=3053509 RepID=UPI00257807E9|nr:ABC transporter substrate-binding protein [Variovorax sp. J22R115]MDM0047801.1 ABC transporter substrate-binding protein [Variovorax sp. J22R115]